MVDASWTGCCCCCWSLVVGFAACWVDSFDDDEEAVSDCGVPAAAGGSGLLMYSRWDVSSPFKFLRQTGHVPCYQVKANTKQNLNNAHTLMYLIKSLREIEKLPVLAIRECMVHGNSVYKAVF